MKMNSPGMHNSTRRTLLFSSVENCSVVTWEMKDLRKVKSTAVRKAEGMEGHGIGWTQDFSYNWTCIRGNNVYTVVSIQYPLRHMKSYPSGC